jgi:hypothetical protein
VTGKLAWPWAAMRYRCEPDQATVTCRAPGATVNVTVVTSAGTVTAYMPSKTPTPVSPVPGLNSCDTSVVRRRP